MEFIEGTDLASLVKDKGAVPLALACECARQSALALQHAHEQGLVHRDIKPGNLLLAGDGTVKLLDLGLARLGASGEDDAATSLTDTGLLMGTPDYVAPEQILDSKRVDIRADLYSLGCTLYHLLTGRPPFAGGTAGQKLIQHQMVEPPAIATLRPEVPATLVAVVQKLMAKRPEDRYQSPAEVAAVLDHLLRTGKLGGGPFAGLAGWAGVIPGSWLGRARPSWQGRRLLAALVVAVLLLGSAGLALLLWPAPPPKRDVPAKEEQVRPPPSPLAQLTFEKIRARERDGTGLLKPETVQVLGSHQGQHGSQVNCLAFHPDGKRAFSGGAGGVVRVWDTATMRQTDALPVGIDHAANALGVVGDPDGQLALCACTHTGWVWRWDAGTLQSLGKPEQRGPFRCFSPDGRYGLLASPGDNARLVDIQEKRDLKRFPDVLPGLGGATFTADGKRALVAVKKGQFSLLETATGKELWRFHGVPSLMTRLVMPPDCKHVLSIDEAGNAWLWDTATNCPIRRFVPEQGNDFMDLALSDGGRRAVMLHRLGNLEVWDLKDQRKLRSVGQPRPDSPAHVLALTPDGRLALTANGSGRLRLWDLEHGEELCARSDNIAGASCVALSPDGLLALSGHQARTTLHDVVSGKVVKTFAEKGGWIQAVAFSPDGSRFAYGGLNGKLYLRQTDTKELLWPAQQAHSYIVRALVFSRDGRRLYSEGGDPYRSSLEVGAIRVWDTETGKPLRQLRGHTAAVHCLALSPDGRHLLSGAGDLQYRDCTVRLWDTASREQLKRFDAHKAPVTSVAFAPNGKQAVSVSYNQTILWDLTAPSAKKAGRDLKLGSGVVTFVDERHFVHAGWANRLLVCDLDGKIISERSLPHPVNGLALSADRKYLATANNNGTVYILRLPLRPPR
jgi:WD40 repeat protein